MKSLADLGPIIEQWNKDQLAKRAQYPTDITGRIPRPTPEKRVKIKSLDDLNSAIFDQFAAGQHVHEDPEPELEFKVFGFCLDAHTLLGSDGTIDTIKDLLTDKWQIDDKIICSPYVIITLSREKETKENE